MDARWAYMRPPRQALSAFFDRKRGPMATRALPRAESERALMYTNAANDNHAHVAPLSEAHRRQLHDRGLTDATIHAAGLWSANTQQVADLLGFDPKSGGIVIP